MPWAGRLLDQRLSGSRYTTKAVAVVMHAQTAHCLSVTAFSLWALVLRSPPIRVNATLSWRCHACDTKAHLGE
jgi:hypothetical protein